MSQPADDPFPNLAYQQPPSPRPYGWMDHLTFWCSFVAGAVLSLFISDEIDRWRFGHYPDMSLGMMAIKSLGVYSAAVLLAYLFVPLRRKPRRARAVAMAMVLGVLGAVPQVVGPMLMAKR